MDNETQQLIAERLSQLPRKKREQFLSGEFTATIRMIAGKYDLSASERETLDKEAMIILFGFEPVENFVDNILEGIDVSEDTARHIAEDINWLVFPQVGEGGEEGIGEEEKFTTQDSILSRMQAMRTR